jgi:exodeoxyribonuclease VII small subunit
VAAKKTTEDLSALSYEQARDQLIDVVTRLEAGGATLEESLTLWERGEALAARCQEWLDGARERLSKARGADPSGSAPGGGAPAAPPATAPVGAGDDGDDRDDA